ncbi:MAG: YqgE/AlgH family protein [Bacteroidota bacterium]
MIEMKRGKLLLAEPYMEDPHFKRSVVLLTEYSKEEGSVGFILNKPIAMKINELVNDFPDIDCPVFYGGPVAQETLHYIHDLGDVLDDSISISPNVWWGGDYEKLKFLISSQYLQPRNIRFFLGYSGWSPGQLEDEMLYGSWVMSDMDSNYLFATRHVEMWSKVMRNKGDRYSVIAEMPDSFILN